MSDESRYCVEDGMSGGILYWYVYDLRNPNAARYKTGGYEPYEVSRFPYGPEGEKDARDFAALLEKRESR